MGQLIAMLLAGTAVLVWGLSALFRMVTPDTGNWEFWEVELGVFIELRALNFKDPFLLFSDSDFRILVREPKLAYVARRLRADRRRIALRWLADLRADVLLLWRLRRLLFAYGVKQGTADELRTTLTACSMLIYTLFLRVGVYLFGPFALAKVVGIGYRELETYTRTCQSALARLPNGKVAEFSAEWRTREMPVV